MQDVVQRPYSRVLGFTVALAAIAYVAVAALREPRALFAQPFPLLLLAAAATVAGRLVAARGYLGPRLTATFVLAALVLLPSPAPLVVAALGALAAGGGGVAGPFRRDATSFGALLVAVAVAEHFVARLGVSHAATFDTLLVLSVLLLVIQGLAFALALGLEAGARDEPADPRRAWTALAVETVTVPLAWLLVGRLAAGERLAPAVLAAAVVAALALLVAREQQRSDLLRTQAALTARLTELATLHSVGREILASIDAGRVLSVIDRECRKILDVDECLVALVDPDTAELHGVWRRPRAGRPETRTSYVEGGILASVASEKRARRVDDLARAPLDSPLRGDLVAPDARSILAVPLLVEDRVTGVLAVTSRRPRAYDDHGLSILTTVAQQAAVAIESARHYEKATVDSLTGFLTRDYFLRRLADEDRRVRRYGGSFALLMVDLDGFKEINDRNGHLAGDRYLAGVATTIRGELRAADLACRFGGDEFCLLLPETDLAGAQVIAERVRDAVSRRIVGVDGLALRTTASIGFTAFPEHRAPDPQGLLRNADEALYRAKRAGRDRVAPFAA
jgi:diguanylate cyclase (GGDEF)-like protein